jgi:hydroxyacylglutathione hydrolase
MMKSSLEIARIENDHCSSNAYIVAASGSSSAVVIDPADLNSHKIGEQLSAKGCSKLLVVLTHEHFDHMSGVKSLRASFDTQVVTSRACSQSISDPKKNLSRYTIGIDIDCQPADIICEEVGSSLLWEHFALEFVPAPGHSPGSICIGIDQNLFTGDTIVPGHQTVVRLPGGDRHILESTIATLFERFPKETVIYPGHGDPCRLGDIDPSSVLNERAASTNDK